MAKTKSLHALMDEMAHDLALYFSTGEHNTDLLRAVAANVVELRGRSIRASDGTPDWGGRSQEYRDRIREVYSRANLSPAQVADMPHKLQYHTRAALDEQVPADQLAAAGFTNIAPKARQTAKRATDAAIAATLAPERTTVELMVYADRLLKRAVEEGFGSLTEKDLEVCRLALTAIEKHAGKLRAAATKAARAFG